MASDCRKRKRQAMRTRRTAVVSALAAMSMLAVGACGATAEKKETSKSDGPVTDLRIMVPNTPGGGTTPRRGQRPR